MVELNNTMRVSGLASGMDTESIVKSLVQVQSARLDKLQQTKTLTTWKSDAYRDVNKKVDEFRKAMEGLRLNSTFNKQTVTSSDPRVAVSSGGTSTRTDFVITQAELATSAKPAMVSIDNKGAGVGSTGFTFNLTTQVSGGDPSTKSITLAANKTLDEVVAEINKSSSETNVRASNVGGSLVFTAVNAGESTITI